MLCSKDLGLYTIPKPDAHIGIVPEILLTLQPHQTTFDVFYEAYIEQVIDITMTFFNGEADGKESKFTNLYEFIFGTILGDNIADVCKRQDGEEDREVSQEDYRFLVMGTLKGKYEESIECGCV